VTKRIVAWTLAITFVLALLLAGFKVSLARVIGVAGLVAFALAFINLFGSFVLTFWPLRRGLPPMAPLLLLWAGLIGAINDDHIVEPASLPPLRHALALDVHDADRFIQHKGSLLADRRLIFIASEGGGIRAAYWTAAVLEEMARQAQSGTGAPNWEAHLYALSGVSGGSLGLASWLVSNLGQFCPGGFGDERPAGASLFQSPPKATAALGMDFVSPPVAGMLYYDLLQRFFFLPIPFFDRSRALEDSFRQAFSAIPGRPFERQMLDVYAGCEGLPRLMLNSTNVETGQRVVLSPFGDDRKTFHGILEAMRADFGASSQDLAGWVHHSARFPGISPAGTVRRVRPTKSGVDGSFRLIDGGYFDNSGVESVLDLIDAQSQSGQGFRSIVILIRNSPGPQTGVPSPERLHASGVFPEIGAVVGGLYNVRDAHAQNARARLQSKYGGCVIDAAYPPSVEQPPLGWALSDFVRREMQTAARAKAAEVLKELGSILDGTAPKGPC
jgi:hypothetical protein